MLTFPKGQAALISLLVIATLGGITAVGLSTITLSRLQLSREVVSSLQSYEAAEAGVEDAVYRYVNPTIGDPVDNDDYNHELANVDIVIASTDSGDNKVLTARATKGSYTRAVSATITNDADVVSFSYGVQAGQGGVTLQNSASIDGSVLSDGDIIGSGSKVTGGAYVTNTMASSVVVTPVAASSLADQFFADSSTKRDIAQSFTATTSTTINRVGIYVAKIGSPDDLTVRIANNGTNRPGTTSLASETLVASKVSTTAGWVYVTFDTPATVVNGTKYWLVLDQGNSSSSNKWNWKRNSGNPYASNDGCTTGNWSNDALTCSSVGDLVFSVSYGAAGRKIEGINAGAGVKANLLKSTYVGTYDQNGNYTNAVLCPNTGTASTSCEDTTETARPFPITDAQIAEWQSAITAPCAAAGTYSVSSGEVTLGNCKITGDLAVNSGGTLALTGMIWVTGEVRVLTGGIIKVDDSYQAGGGSVDSGTIIVDGDIVVSNTSQVNGKDGLADSYVLLITTKHDTGSNSIRIGNNNNTSAIYYAPYTNIRISSSAQVKSLAGYGITLENSATLHYDTGVAGLPVASGPTGGWAVLSWKEVP